jgi:hypothetical protein
MADKVLPSAALPGWDRSIFTAAGTFSELVLKLQAARFQWMTPAVGFRTE